MQSPERISICSHSSTTSSIGSRVHYFTKLDVHWGYNNVCICEGDEWKATFHTNRGLFEPLVMYFGLTNSLATFQTMMNKIFQDLITEGVVSVYLNDILIFTNSLEEHRRVTSINSTSDQRNVSSRRLRSSILVSSSPTTR
jgi:hypothetical protein